MSNYREKNWILNTEHPLGPIRPGYNGNHQVSIPYGQDSFKWFVFNKAVPTDMWAYYFENISLIIYKTFG